MKALFGAMLTLIAVSPALANDHVVHWDDMVGVIAQVGDTNPVADINSGTFPWSARRGFAVVNFTSGSFAFDVQGLVINGTQFTGTTGPVTAVTGTLVCDAGQPTERALDSQPVVLSQGGRAKGAGTFENIPGSCGNPLFLIRIATPAGAAGRWIATGAERHTQN